jgi:GNAT superfamily N-acetyltransferase
MELCDISEAIDLWQKQSQHFNAGKQIYPFWVDKNEAIEIYLKSVISDGNAFIAKLNGKLAGFITCNIFDFHGASSAICHFIGNAAAIDNRERIYLALYNIFCEHCVSRKALVHYIAICPDDTEIRELLFNLGFGAYVIDAFAQFNKSMDFMSGYNIGLAHISDAAKIFELYCESQKYFLSSPIYLKLPLSALARIEEKIKQDSVYTAKNNGKVIGVWDLELANEDNIYRLYSKNNALVCGEIGAYIKEEYRGKGIGNDFIKIVSDFCMENEAVCAHVPWETFNPSANKFWRKYFTPASLALKRVIHADTIE